MPDRKVEQLTFQETGGGIFEAVGDSIIDLGGVKTQEGAAAAKGRRRRRRRRGDPIKLPGPVFQI